MSTTDQSIEIDMYYKNRVLYNPSITVTTPSYTIYKVNNVVYAKNGMQGTIDFQGINASEIIEKAIAAGGKYIFVKGAIFWTPTGNFIAGGVYIEGEDQQNFVISSANPDNDYISIGPMTILSNLSIFDRSGVTQGLSPNTKRSIGFYCNLTYVNKNPSSWFRQYIAVDMGAPGIDNPGIGVNQWGIGDAFWAGNVDVGVGYRVHNNEVDITKAGTGILVANFGSGTGILGHNMTSSNGILCILQGESNRPLLHLSNLSGLPFTEYLAGIVSTQITSGNMFQIYHSMSSFYGNGIKMDFGNGTGSFTGNFIDLKVAGITKFSVDNKGDVLTTLATYPNNAAAIAGGLVTGQLYRTGSDPDVVCVVH